MRPVSVAAPVVAVVSVREAEKTAKEPSLRPVVAPPPVAKEPVSEEPTWPDESAEAAFLAEARERGEVVKPSTAATTEPVEDADPKALPPLDELVNRIPAEVRDTLEDLFRAKFVRVQRVPKRVLKGSP